MAGSWTHRHRKTDKMKGQLKEGGTERVSVEERRKTNGMSVWGERKLVNRGGREEDGVGRGAAERWGKKKVKRDNV